jgi:hypothetical protein
LGLIPGLAANGWHLSEKPPAARTAHEKAVLERQIAATDGEIDRPVYELYELTEDEIRIVEEATGEG